jgi:hypothetical protein
VSLDELQRLESEHVIGTYARLPVEFVRGEGSWLWDSEGNQYLDLLCGISVTNLGHCHPRVVEAEPLDGDARAADALAGIPGVASAHWSPERRAAELALAPSADARAVMGAAMAATPLMHVALRRTTLDDVFVELVGEAAPPSEESGNG